MKIIDTELVSELDVSKNFIIQLDDGNNIIVNKWFFISNDGADDFGSEIVSGKEFYEKMSEKQQDEFNDFMDTKCQLINY